MLAPASLLLLGASLVSAHGDHHRRQVNAASTPTAGGLIQTTPQAQPGGATIPALTEITANAPTQTTQTLFSSVAAPTAGPFSNAPEIPKFTFVAGTYPELDKAPDPNSDQVKQWLAELDLSKVPDLSVTNGSCADNPTEAADKSRCWWTCGQCVRETDITTCPTKYTFGLSFDDGPSPYTPLVLDYLEVEKLKATFFVVGSRVISRPDMLQLEHAAGHQISIHTWSHTALTTQTNAQIVAELGWTRKAIKDVIGVSPNTMRPPYGDIDDRVRAICAAMGITPIIWTGLPDGTNFDTDDWKIFGGTATGQSSVAAFDKILEDASKLDTGFIVLEHDLYQQSVDLAVGYILPSVQNSTNPKFNLQSIVECHGQSVAEAYLETASNTTTPTGANSTSSASGSAASIAANTKTVPTASLTGSALSSAAMANAAAASAASSAKASSSASARTSVVALGAGLVGAVAVVALAL